MNANDIDFDRAFLQGGRWSDFKSVDLGLPAPLPGLQLEHPEKNKAGNNSTRKKQSVNGRMRFHDGSLS